MPFIPVEQLKQLREAAKNGDTRAKKILSSYMNKEDYSADFDAYFTPQTQPQEMEEGNPGSVQEAVATKGTGNAKLDQFLADNGVKEGDSDYEDALNDYYNEFPNERPAEMLHSAPEQEAQPEAQEGLDLTQEIGQGIIDLISKCDKTLLEVMQSEEIDDTSKKGAMTSLQEIKQSLFDSAEKIKKIKSSFHKEEESV